MNKPNWPHLTFPHTQEIAFDNGQVRVLRNVVHVEQGKWAHIICEDDHGGSETIVNPDKVLFIRIRRQDGPEHTNTGKK